MLRHLIGFGGAADGGLQLSLTVVLDTKNGDAEHEAITVTKGVIKLQFFTYQTLYKAKPGAPHVCEGGIRVLEEKFLLAHLPVRLHGTFVGAGSDLAGTNVPILVKANPCIQLTVKVALSLERQ